MPKITCKAINFPEYCFSCITQVLKCSLSHSCVSSIFISYLIPKCIVEGLMLSLVIIFSPCIPQTHNSTLIIMDCITVFPCPLGSI
uniref:Macaca fascicularis brain cDNA clone: QflA-22711, similar to human hypothetical protein BC001610 (LOC91661), mRNA, RefSeq: NM_138372.1 n=1 Tax=Macaca fascicularis TaxID=9541 RepID=I7GNW9_MACFA|nr:unnamed protein product [Macaca fascicularis]